MKFIENLFEKELISILDSLYATEAAAAAAAVVIAVTNRESDRHANRRHRSKTKN